MRLLAGGLLRKRVGNTEVETFMVDVCVSQAVQMDRVVSAFVVAVSRIECRDALGLMRSLIC